MDDNNDKAISYQEFTKAMRDYKIELTEREVRIIFDEIDRDNSGSLSIDELVRAIQVWIFSFIKKKKYFLGWNEQFQNRIGQSSLQEIR